MGKRLHKQDVHVDLVCSSPAKRAMATAQIVSKILGYSPDSIHYEKKLYHANAETILQVLNSFDDNKSCAMIVGHNPGLTEFVNDLLDEDILNIPTAGVVGGQLRIDSWKKAKWKCGELLLFDYPKKNRIE